MLMYVIHTGTYTYTQLILSMPLAALQTDQYAYVIEYTCTQPIFEKLF